MSELIDREQIKQAFIAQRGYWRPWTETLLEVNPGFVQQYARYAGYPAQQGPLSARLVELIYVGLDASSSHLFSAGLQTHMLRALEVGATPADIFDVLHLVAVQGLASVGQAAELLAEVFALPAAALSPRAAQLAAGHGLNLEQLAQLDPGYVGVLLDFIEHGYAGDGGAGQGLTPAERSLVQLALHACFTAFNRDSVRQLLVTAKSQALTSAELLQAIQLGAHLAVHGTALGATVFRQMPAADLSLKTQPGDKS